MSLLLAVAILALLTFTLSLVYVGRAVVLRMNEPRPPGDDRVATDEIALLATRFHAEIESLRFAIAEGIERTDRAEKRVQKTVASARRLLRENGLEHAPLEAEAAELHERDGAGVDEQPVLPVPPSVAPTRRLYFPGASPEFLRRIGAL